MVVPISSKVACWVTDPTLIDFNHKKSNYHVEHLASRAVGVRERIASVTSFRTNIPGIYDVSFTTNTRHWTDLKIMYREWTHYRLAFLAKEIDEMRKRLDEATMVDLEEFATFARNQIEYLQRTQRQMVPYDFHRESLDRHGIKAYTAAPEIWEDMKGHPDFNRKVAALDPNASWEFTREYIGDLAQSQAALARGEILQGQTGPVKGISSHPYVMGDELIRQGQRELFFQWAEKTGLLALRS